MIYFFFKAGFKKIQFNFEAIDIVHYIKYFIDELSWDFEEQDIKVQCKVDVDTNELVIVDREKLKRVLVNIIQNSLKHMKKGEKIIRFSVVERGHNIEIEINDYGDGIDPASLPYIFDRFYRADSARNTVTGGSGLGLAIAKQIISEHGGEIWAASEIGKGTSIFFTLRYAKK